MAVFTIQTPDGRELDIEAADEATAVRGAQEWVSQNPKGAAPAQAAPAVAPAAPAASVQDQLNAVLRGMEQPEAPPVDNSGNPYASQLPGVLGDIADASKARLQGMGEGATANWGNELFSGLAAVPDFIGKGLSGQGWDYGKAFQDQYAHGEQVNDQLRALDPGAYNAGQLLGGVGLAGRARTGGAPATRAAPPPSPVKLGAQAGAVGAISGAGLGDTLEERAMNAAIGGGSAAILGHGAGKLIAPNVPKHVKQVAKSLHREGLTLAQVEQRMQDLGQNGMLADLGSNPTRLASTLASMPGEAQGVIRGNLTTRAAGANQRIRDALDNELGPSPIPSLEQAGITAGQEALSPAYQAVLRNAQPVDVAPIVQNIDGNIQLFRGETQDILRRLRPMFNNHGTNNITANAAVLLEIRKAIDGLFEGNLTKQTRGALTEIRRQVDAELARAVPGIKQVDAQFEDLARQSGALTRGEQVLGTGPESPWPIDLATEMGTATPGVQRRLSQGTRILLERIVGTNANDVAKLNQIIKGEGDWNRDKLRILFGDARADAMLRVLDNETTFARTNAIAQQGPETAARLAGQKDLSEVNLNIPTSATLEGMGLSALSKVATWLANSRGPTVNRAMAELLTTRGLPPAVRRALQQALTTPQLASAVPGLGATVAAIEQRARSAQ